MASVKFIRAAGYVMFAAFVVVGALFLLVPGRVIGFFNGFSRPLGLPQAPASEAGLFVILAVAYMAVVSALAWSMGRHPENSAYPRLLALAKISSSLLSAGFFIFRARYLVVFANAVVDGAIGLGVLWVSLLASPQDKTIAVPGAPAEPSPANCGELGNR